MFFVAFTVCGTGWLGCFTSLTVSSAVPPQPFQEACGLPPGSVAQGAGRQSLCLPVGFDFLTHLALVSSVSLQWVRAALHPATHVLD